MRKDSTGTIPLSALKREAHAIRAEIVAVIDGHLGGNEDTEALRKMRALCFRLKRMSGPFAEKAESIEAHAAILYSEREHAKYGGVATVRRILRHDLVSIGTIIERIYR
jgi:hypothetical protein